MAQERRCGLCENYKYTSATGNSEGYCIAYPLEDDPDNYKWVFFNTDARKCPKFKEVEEIITDHRETIYHPHLRFYGEEEK